MSDDYELLDELNADLFSEDFLKHLEEKKVIAAKNSQIMSDYQRTFETDHGRRVLMDIVATGKVFHTTFTGNAWANYFEGFRSFALYVIHMVAKNKYLKKDD